MRRRARDRPGIMDVSKENRRVAAHPKDARTGHSIRKATSTKTARRKAASTAAKPRTNGAAKPIRYYVVRT